MVVNSNPCNRPNVEICRCVGFVLKAVPSLVAMQQFRYCLSALFRLNTVVHSCETLTGRARGSGISSLPNITNVDTALAQPADSARAKSSAFKSLKRCPFCPYTHCLLSILPPPRRTHPSSTILHTSRRPGEQRRSKLTYVHIANGNTTHFCGLEGSEEGVGEKVGWRKSRWARVEVTKFKRHTNSPRWVCVVITSVCRGFA